MNRLKKIASIQFAILIAGILLSVQTAAAQGWDISAPNQKTGLSAVYALSLSLGDDGDYQEKLWVGDEAGNFGVVTDPEVQLGTRWNALPPTNPPSRGQAGNLSFIKWRPIPVGAVSATARRNAPPDPINDIYFRNLSEGYLLKGNNIYRTADGGQSWSVFLNVPDRNKATATLYSLSFFPKNKNKGCVVGVYTRGDDVTENLVECGDTSDPRSWQIPDLPESQNELFHLSLVGSDHGWIVGSEGTILKTSDGGDHWGPQKAPKGETLLHVNFVNSDRGLAVGENGTILRTTNGGEEWRVVPDPLPGGMSHVYTAVKFADEDHAWIVGRGGLILYTRDGGKAWSLQVSKTQENLSGLFIDSKYCWAIGSKGLVLRYALPPKKKDGSWFGIG